MKRPIRIELPTESPTVFEFNGAWTWLNGKPIREWPGEEGKPWYDDRHSQVVLLLNELEDVLKDWAEEEMKQ